MLPLEKIKLEYKISKPVRNPKSVIVARIETQYDNYAKIKKVYPNYKETKVSIIPNSLIPDRRVFLYNANNQLINIMEI